MKVHKDMYRAEASEKFGDIVWGRYLKQGPLYFPASYSRFLC